MFNSPNAGLNSLFASVNPANAANTAVNSAVGQLSTNLANASFGMLDPKKLIAQTAQQALQSVMPGGGSPLTDALEGAVIGAGIGAVVSGGLAMNDALKHGATAQQAVGIAKDAAVKGAVGGAVVGGVAGLAVGAIFG